MAVSAANATIVPTLHPMIVSSVLGKVVVISVTSTATKSVMQIAPYLVMENV